MITDHKAINIYEITEGEFWQLPVPISILAFRDSFISLYFLDVAKYQQILTDSKSDKIQPPHAETLNSLIIYDHIAWILTLTSFYLDNPRRGIFVIL